MSVRPKLPSLAPLSGRIASSVAARITTLGQLNSPAQDTLKPEEMKALFNVLDELRFLQAAQGTIEELDKNITSVAGPKGEALE